jgi:two-component system, NarL family, nitrate/nitrite response regulator NarL
MKVVLGYGQRLCTDALAAALSGHGVSVVAVAQTQDDVLAAVAEHEPDICLLSARGSAGSVLATMGALRARYPAVKLVVLTDGSDPSALAAAAQLGAAALVSRGQQLADLIALLERVRAGKGPQVAGLAQAAVSNSGAGSGPASESGLASKSGLAHLTAREQEILALMIEGRATKEIARSLAITVHTVRTHAQSVLVKLGAHSRLEASGILVRRGLLGPAAHLPVRESAANRAGR